MTNVPEGVASSQVYLVNYNEDQWLRYDEEGVKFCIDTWLTKAKQQGCRRLVLKLVPDTLFPRNPDRPLPYIHYQQDIVQESSKGFKVHYAKVSLQVDEPDISVSLRTRIEKYLSTYPAGTAYKVWYDSGNTEVQILLQGKVNK